MPTSNLLFKMGAPKYLSKVESLFRKSPVVSSRSIARITQNPNYTKQLLRHLVQQGKIKRLTQGYYTAYDDASLAVFCFKPAYLALQDALSFHNLWEQETIPVILTAKRIRPGLRKILGSNVLLRRIEKKYFFGFGYYPQKEFYLPYSDIEKTFIDLVYFKQKISPDLLRLFQKKADPKKIKNYLRPYPARFSRTVLKLLA